MVVERTIWAREWERVRWGRRGRRLASGLWCWWRESFGSSTFLQQCDVGVVIISSLRSLPSSQYWSGEFGPPVSSSRRRKRNRRPDWRDKKKRDSFVLFGTENIFFFFLVIVVWDSIEGIDDFCQFPDHCKFLCKISKKSWEPWSDPMYKGLSGELSGNIINRRDYLITWKVSWRRLRDG